MMQRVSTHGRRETPDDYQDVIAMLDERHRVVVCKNGLQWIVQRCAKKPKALSWMGLGYCRTSKALLRVSRASREVIEPDALTVLAALHRHVEGGD